MSAIDPQIGKRSIRKPGIQEMGMRELLASWLPD
jgi:hypothetical protein